MPAAFAEFLRHFDTLLSLFSPIAAATLFRYFDLLLMPIL